VRDRLGGIRAPTVVVHGTADPMFPLEHGRALAAAIPGARLLALDGFGHATLARRFWPELLSAMPGPRPPAGG
jgi:pimeloyl-ACP methyl ester carboxylesterase